MTRISSFAALLVVMALAFGFRVVPVHPYVFPSPGSPRWGPSNAVRYLDSDSYYHLRHSSYILLDFPRFHRNDCLEHFPDERRSDGIGLFNLSVATIAWIAAGFSSDVDLMKQLAAWVAPLLGCLAVLLLHALARSWISPPLALWCAAAWVLWPGQSLSPTLLGYVDHHVAEIVLGLATVLGFQEHWRRPLPGSLGASLARGLVASFPLVAFVFTWNGAGLHVAALATTFLPLILLEILQGEDVLHTARACFSYGTAATLATLMIALPSPPMVISQHSFSFVTLALAAMGLYPRVLAELARRAASRGWGRRRITAALVAIVAFVILITFGGTQTGRFLVERLLGSKPEAVAENVGPSLPALLADHGPIALLALIVWPLLAVTLRRDRRRRGLIIPATYGLIWFVLWERSHDYGYVVPPWIAFLAAVGITLASDLEYFPRILRSTPVATLLLLMLLAPPLVTDRFTQPWSTPAGIGPLLVSSPGWEEALEWVRTRTPSPFLPGRRSPFPEKRGRRMYGVASSWDRGNLVTWLGKRPAVWSRYPERTEGRWFTTTEEEESLGIFEKLTRPGEPVRYVMINARRVTDQFLTTVPSSGHSIAEYQATAATLTFQGQEYSPASYGKRYDEAISVRLYYRDGVDMGHYRLVFESRQRSRHRWRIASWGVLRIADFEPEHGAWKDLEPLLGVGQIRVLPNGELEYDESLHAAVKVFEIVAGADWTGTALFGSTIHIQLDLLVESTGRSFRYERRIPVAKTGPFHVRLPYPTTEMPAASTIRAQGAYRFTIDGLGGSRLQEGTISVQEEDVQRGRPVAASTTAESSRSSLSPK